MSFTGGNTAGVPSFDIHHTTDRGHMASSF
jgi:hypothetical protein